MAWRTAPLASLCAGLVLLAAGLGGCTAPSTSTSDPMTPPRTGRPATPSPLDNGTKLVALDCIGFYVDLFAPADRVQPEVPPPYKVYELGAGNAQVLVTGMSCPSSRIANATASAVSIVTIDVVLDDTTFYRLEHYINDGAAGWLDQFRNASWDPIPATIKVDASGFRAQGTHEDIQLDGHLAESAPPSTKGTFFVENVVRLNRTAAVMLRDEIDNGATLDAVRLASVSSTSGVISRIMVNPAVPLVGYVYYFFSDDTITLER